MLSAMAVIMLSLCLLSFWGISYCGSNIALNKPAKQSSVYIVNNKHFTADRAVDGNDVNVENMEMNSCIHTSDANGTEQAWWQVNLEGMYSITLVEISYRNWGGTANINSGAARLAGFSIYISATENWWNGQLCYHDNSTTLRSTAQTMYFFCYKTARGQYLTIYNDRNVSVKYSPSYSKRAILELCEVEVDAPCLHCKKVSYPYCINKQTCAQGCEVGFYGDKCESSCSCGGDGSCNQSDGRCIVCEEGTYVTGTSCVSCPDKCRGQNNICNSTSGFCLQGCDDTFFGPTCAHSCPENCRQCSSLNKCSLCNDKYFGSQCEKMCLNCKHDQCNISGNCKDGCKFGVFGSNCEQNCSMGCLTGECDRYTGKCSVGCKSGYYGLYCEQSCPDNCALNSRNCEENTGECFECKTSFFGPSCSFNCSRNCGGNGSCHMENGNCKQSCETGWEGPTCERATVLSLSNIHDLEEGSSTGAIAGGVVAAVVVIIVAVITVVFIRKRRGGVDKIKKRHMSDATRGPTEEKQDNVYLNVGYGPTTSEVAQSSKSQEVSKTNPKNSSLTERPSQKFMHSTGKPDLKPKPRKSTHDYYMYTAEANEYYNTECIAKGIPVDDFKGHVAKMIAEGKLLAEYEDIPYGALYQTTAAEKTENRTKNRFKTTFPYDKTIVTLHNSGLKTPKYINANFIHGIYKENKYIATQGPLPNTVDDFWRMVWQYDVGKVVMLTGIVEGGKDKCDKYWPDPNESMEHGGFTLSTLDERKYSYYTLRDIKMENKKNNIQFHLKGKQSRHLLHFHFTAWPDHDVTNPVLLVQFHRRVTTKHSTGKGPLLVHCSAGIGRTGTYIGLDELLEQAKKQGRIDVKGYVRKMRDCRMNMVQKPLQYQLLHEALVEALQIPESSIKMSDFPAEWEQMQSENQRPVNQQRLKKEYEILKEKKRVCSMDDFKSAHSKENNHKNRPKSSLPLDEYRPYLMKHVKGRTSYINAVIIPSYTSDKGYFVTQRPLKDTVVDFWRLICDHDTKLIIHFESDDEDKTTFYPASDQLNTDEFTISTVKKQKISDTLEEYEIVVFCKGEDEETTVNLIKVSTMKLLRPDSMTLIKAAELAKSKNIGPHQSPVTVVSSDGTHSCDVFCAVMNVLESMRLDNEIDMFQTVRQLQMRRPEFFAEFENYRLAYEAIYKHLTSENVYFNYM